MKASPAGWPRITAAIFYEEPAQAIDWLCRTFGFEVRIKVEGDNGRIEHSELTFGEGVIMVAGAGEKAGRPEATHLRSPKALSGANTQSLMVYLDDVEAHCATARARGAKITREPATSDYGEEYWADRSYEAEDLEGHRWYFAQRIRDPKS